MLKLEGVKKYFTNAQKQRVTILDDISIEVPQGEFITIFGPNGSGKSTLMNIISGLELPSEGNVILEAQSKEISYLFQDYKSALLPWKTAYQNIALPLYWKGISKAEAKQSIQHLINKFDVNINLNSYPFTLSGGQAQLISIIRSIVVNPDILILDEPFSALDYVNRVSLLVKLQGIWLASSLSCIFISHDIDEAIFLGDRLVILSPKPTRIVDVIDIDLPRPRSIDMLTSLEFTSLKKRALSRLNLV
jgi:NitT/TauT family transport system ATP-binding protein